MVAEFDSILNYVDQYLLISLLVSLNHGNRLLHIPVDPFPQEDGSITSLHFIALNDLRASIGWIERLDGGIKLAHFDVHKVDHVLDQVL